MARRGRPTRAHDLDSSTPGRAWQAGLRNGGAFVKPVVILLALGLFGTASVSRAAPDVLVGPDWLRKPTPDQLLAVWPIGAAKQGKKGRGVIDCSVSLQGALFDCNVVSEEPAGSGFGGAALALTPQFLMKPATLNGVPIVAPHHRIGVTFLWPAGSTGALSTSRVISNVVWREAPTYAEVVAAYPAKARSQGVGGNATLDCILKADGRLRGCSVLGETPNGMGFGAAATSLSDLFVGPLSLGDGTSIKGASVQIPVTFPLAMTTSTKPMTGKPRWTAGPAAEDLAGAIPAAAVTAGVKTARVKMSCTVIRGGAVADCAVVSEEPSGLGFGAATLGLAKGIRVSIWTSEGLPTVGGGVTVPIRYEIPPPAAPTAKP